MTGDQLLGVMALVVVGMFALIYFAAIVVGFWIGWKLVTKLFKWLDKE